jgi:hypothetical protein
MSNESAKQLELNIPHAQDRVVSSQLTLAERTKQQAELIEQKFKDIVPGEPIQLELELNSTLTADICRALTNKGYSYSYSYVQNGSEKPTCNVKIYTNQHQIPHRYGASRVSQMLDDEVFNSLRCLFGRPLRLGYY